MRRAFLIALVVLKSPGAWSEERPPIIVTYEQKREHDAERAATSHPKAFWVHQIVARIEAKVPSLKRKTKGPATVRLGFVVGRDGHLVSKSVQTSSGDPDLDRIALDMVEKAQPFPPMPAAVDAPQLAFVLPVRFR